MRDFIYAVRNLRKSPGFTATAVLTLGLGIGANMAVFSVVNGVLLKPYPFRQAHRIVFVRETLRGEEWGPASVPDFRDWRNQNRSFENIAVFNGSGVDLAGHGEPRRVETASVSEGFFKVLGVEPVLGRTFTEADIQSKANVAVVSESFSRRYLNTGKSVVGRAVDLGGAAYTVIGVIPERLAFPLRTQVWLPERMDGPYASDRGSHYLPTIARLKPGVSLEQAELEMSAIAKRLEAGYPATNTGRGILIVRFTEMWTRFVRPMLMVLMASVGLVLLIACANVSNLLLARGAARSQEIAIRAAMGATRARLVRQLLAESAVIAVLSGALAILLGSWGIQAGLALLPDGTLPRQSLISVEGPVLWFTIVVALAAPLLFGALPALRSTKLDATRGGTVRGGAMRNILVVAECATAVVLLVAGGLTLRTFAELKKVDPGFRADHVTAFDLRRTLRTPRDLEMRGATVRNIVDRVRALPGVASVSQTTFLPLGGFNDNGSFHVEGQPPAAPGQAPIAESRWVGAEYFRTMGIPLVEGRDIGRSDEEQKSSVVLINRTLARTFFPGGDAIGKRIGFEDGNGGWSYQQIIGVIGDVKDFGIAAQTRYEVYMPMTHFPDDITQLVVHSKGEAGGVVPSVIRAIHEIDPGQPVGGVTTMETLLEESIAQPRFESWVLTAFACLALLLASAGLYALISYSVSRRTREIGVRMALGAEQGSVLRLVIAEGMRLIAVGAAIGLALAAALSRLIAAQLYGVRPLDPFVYLSVVALLTATALAASYIPARRAARVDPMEALRYE